MTPHRLNQSRIAVRHHPALVIGGGVAGLTTALGLGRATVLVDTPIGVGGSSRLAQGGIAAAIGPDDSPRLHHNDTVAVAGGIAVADLVGLVTDGGPAAIATLQQLGADFDLTHSAAAEATVQRDCSETPRLALGREAGHRRNRIVHAAGDSTGAEVMRALVAAVTASDLDVIDDATAIDLVRQGDRVVGAVAQRTDGTLEVHLAPAVVLATGGYGHAFARTSTPAQVIGTGIAIAARAGAAIADMEFVQFHPTVLDVEADPMPLLTEALRGEGATLVDRHGERFMVAEHPDAELAPRDVVARAVYRTLQQGRRPYLDARTAVGGAFPERFPTVFGLAMAHGIDPRTDLLPVSPAAHYTMGGIDVDRWGRSSMPGLWAVGEVTSSGLHGANRLASNSLLEGLVMGRRAAESIGQASLDAPNEGDLAVPERILELVGQGPLNSAEVESDRAVQAIRTLMWEAAGVERNGPQLLQALEQLEAIEGSNEALNPTVDDAALVARLVVGAALSRTESRGAHARTDWPHLDPTQAMRRTQVVGNGPTVPLAIDGTLPLPVG